MTSSHAVDCLLSSITSVLGTRAPSAKVSDFVIVSLDLTLYALDTRVKVKLSAYQH